MVEQKHNDATHNRPEGNRPLDADVVKIDIPDCIRKIKSEDTWMKNDRNAMTVFKNSEATIVIIALRGGAELKPHSDTGFVVFQVMEGSVDFYSNEDKTELLTGCAVVAHKEIKYGLKAKQDSVVMMTSTGS